MIDVAKNILCELIKDEAIKNKILSMSDPEHIINYILDNGILSDDELEEFQMAFMLDVHNGKTEPAYTLEEAKKIITNPPNFADLPKYKSLKKID
jgi:hypothetical protein